VGLAFETIWRLLSSLRRHRCGMMTAVDDSLRNVTDVYKELGIWNETIVIFSTDNASAVLV